MSKADKIEMTGVVVKKQKGAKFDVELDEVGKVISCTLTGKLRMNNIRILQGDHVKVEMSPYDLTRGIIVWRDK